MTLAIHHALRTSERATQLIGKFQTAPRLKRNFREIGIHGISLRVKSDIPQSSANLEIELAFVSMTCSKC